MKINKLLYQRYYKYFDFVRYYGFFHSIKQLPRVVFQFFWNPLIDYPLNIIFGPEKTQKLYFSFFKFRCKHNLFFNKRNLWIGKTTLQNVHKVTYADPNKINYVAEQKGTSFYIQSGDWDLKERKLQIHPTIKEIFIDKVPYQETQQYKNMQEAIKNKDYGKGYWCRTQEDIDNYFKKLILAYHSIKKDGYKTQEELRKEDKTRHYDKINEIRVSIDRKGNYILENTGSHRLAIAKLLKIRKIPVIVVRMHYLWAKSIGLIS